MGDENIYLTMEGQAFIQIYSKKSTLLYNSNIYIYIYIHVYTIEIKKIKD